VVARVSALEVKEIVNTEVCDDTLVGNFIDTAHTYVETHLVGTECQNSEAILKKIEMYLAAHFLSITDEGGTLKYTKLGDAAEAYDTGNFGEGLNSTRYGQTAIMLDACGILAGLATTNKKAQFRVVWDPT